MSRQAILRGVNSLANAPTMPKDVTDTVIGSVDLGKEINVDGRQLRTRRLVVQPAMALMAPGLPLPASRRLTFPRVASQATTPADGIVPRR